MNGLSLVVITHQCLIYISHILHQTFACHSQVTNLRKERELVMSRHQSDGSQDGQRVRFLQRENAQLHLKLKGLLSELEEIRAQREHLGMQSDSVARLQSKQLTEHSGNVKALEVNWHSTALLFSFQLKLNFLRILLQAKHLHDMLKKNYVYRCLHDTQF